MRVLRAFIYRVAGAPPEKDAGPAEGLRWIRRMNLRSMTPVTAAALLFALLFLPSWLVVIGAGWQAYTLASISLRIRREEHKEREQIAS